jgi:hypothetical protein
MPARHPAPMTPQEAQLLIHEPDERESNPIVL